MTVATTSNKAQFSGTGSSVPFPFSYKVFAEADLQVIQSSAAGVDTTLALPTHYTVALNADQNNDPGGVVTLVAPVPVGETLTILRVLSETQGTDIGNGSGFYPEVIENALDRLTMISQQNSERINRALIAGVSSDPDGLVNSLLLIEEAAAASAVEAHGYETGAEAAQAAAEAAQAAAEAAVLTVPPVEEQVHAATTKATPVDADELLLIDSATTFSLKKFTWANLKAVLKTYFDTLYAAVGATTLAIGTPVASTAGTSIDFTGIPAGTKRITVSFSGVSTTGTSACIVQLGKSGGVETTGYSGGVGLSHVSGANVFETTAGLPLSWSTFPAADAIHGTITLSLLDAATNTWTSEGDVQQIGSAYHISSAGSKSLSGILDRLRITTIAGTPTFDAGKINISYE